MKTEEWKNGLGDRHISQIIRRKMIQKCVNSKKVYKRKNNIKDYIND
jgi:hypothetical protein